MTYVEIGELAPFVTLARKLHETNRSKGFYDGIDTTDRRQMVEKVLLTVCELAEMTEELRYPEPRMSHKIPDYTAEEEEWADTLHRHLCYAVARGFIARGIGALLAKHEYNKTRPHKHGKIF